MDRNLENENNKFKNRVKLLDLKDENRKKTDNKPVKFIKNKLNKLLSTNIESKKKIKIRSESERKFAELPKLEPLINDKEHMSIFKQNKIHQNKVKRKMNEILDSISITQAKNYSDKDKFIRQIEGIEKINQVEYERLKSPKIESIRVYNKNMNDGKIIEKYMKKKFAKRKNLSLF